MNIWYNHFNNIQYWKIIAETIEFDVMGCQFRFIRLITNEHVTSLVSGGNNIYWNGSTSEKLHSKTIQTKGICLLKISIHILIIISSIIDINTAKIY